jgi:membrane protein implicated in regulation of membrane protease activity
MVVGGLLSMMGFNLSTQLTGAALVAGALVSGWMGFRQHRRKHAAPSTLPASQAHLDAGQTVQVDHWDGHASTSVRYRGANWHAVPEKPGETLTTGAHEVIELRGNSLVLRAIGQ